jgi:hypothetical protein
MRREDHKAAGLILQADERVARFAGRKRARTIPFARLGHVRRVASSPISNYNLPTAERAKLRTEAAHRRVNWRPPERE